MQVDHPFYLGGKIGAWWIGICSLGDRGAGQGSQCGPAEQVAASGKKTAAIVKQLSRGQRIHSLLGIKV